MLIEEALELMRSMTYNSGLLEKAEYFYLDEVDTNPAAIKLTFQENIFFILAKGNDDSIELTKNLLPSQGKEKLISIDVSKTLVWGSVISKNILWSWVMINQQGYIDGIQLEFNDNVKQKSVTFQFIVIASTIKLNIIKPEK